MTEAQDIGRVLKKLREDAGLSQRELAEQLGVQQPAVARWEAGGVRMPINRIEEILAHFGYGIEYDLTAIPISEALSDGVPLQMVRRRSEAHKTSAEYLSVRSGDYEFAVNPAARWSVDMWEMASGRKLPGAVAVYPERIEAIVPHPDGVLIRRAAVDAGVPLITDLQLARAVIEALRRKKSGDLPVLAWEDYVSRERPVSLVA